MYLQTQIVNDDTAVLHDMCRDSYLCSIHEQLHTAEIRLSLGSSRCGIAHSSIHTAVDHISDLTCVNQLPSSPALQLHAKT